MAFSDGVTTFTLEVQALDQFGQPFVPVNTDSVTLTGDTASHTLGGTLVQNFDGATSTIAFTDLTYTGPGGEAATVTATEADNTLTADTTVPII
jgi:hypothetical protein